MGGSQAATIGQRFGMAAARDRKSVVSGSAPRAGELFDRAGGVPLFVVGNAHSDIWGDAKSARGPLPNPLVEARMVEYLRRRREAETAAV